MTDAPSTLHPPAELARRLGGWERDVAWNSHRETTTWRLTRGDAVRYLKVQILGRYPPLEAEATRMRWARGWIPVPEVLGYGQGEALRTTGVHRGGPGPDPGAGTARIPVEWLLTRGLPGVNGVHPSVRRDPERLVAGLARGLRQIHAIPPEACPFDFRIPAALAHVRRRVEAGVVRQDHLHDEFADLDPVTALAELEATVPADERPVVCHGDYCTPNVLLPAGEARAADGAGPTARFGPAGFVDLAELGVADPWWDLAAATWSIGWNLGEAWPGRFLAVYGVEAEPVRMRWYRLLYDLSS